MIRELETSIRERAHRIWEREGRPADRAAAHWDMAAAEIAAEAPAAAAQARRPPGPPRPRRRRASRRRPRPRRSRAGRRRRKQGPPAEGGIRADGSGSRTHSGRAKGLRQFVVAGMRLESGLPLFSRGLSVNAGRRSIGPSPFGPGQAARMAAASTSSVTWASYWAKFCGEHGDELRGLARRRPRGRPRCARGSRSFASTPGTSTGTSKPKFGSRRKRDAGERAVERGGQERAGGGDRHAAAVAVGAAGPAGVDEPAGGAGAGDAVAQQRAVDLGAARHERARRSRWRRSAAAR